MAQITKLLDKGPADLEKGLKENKKIKVSHEGDGLKCEVNGKTVHMSPRDKAGMKKALETLQHAIDQFGGHK